MPPHIGADLVDHLDRFANPGPDGLLFPTRSGVDRQIYGPTFADAFKRAARRAELPETLRFHHLRHAGLTLLAQSGATLAELQARAGHATPGIAMRYQHAVATRDHEIARALSRLAEGSEAGAQLLPSHNSVLDPDITCRDVVAVTKLNEFNNGLPNRRPTGR